MKIVFLILVSVFFLSDAMGERQTLFKCSLNTPERSAPVTYELQSEGEKYFLVKFKDRMESIRVELSTANAVLGYGGSYIFFSNFGRSGYQLVQFHSGISPTAGPRTQAFIDIDVFSGSLREMNTIYPLRDFSCETSR